MCEDNTACIEWGNNVISGRERAKPIDIRKHFAHEVRLVRVPTASQLADVFTKPLHYPQWKACVEGIHGKSIIDSVSLGISVLKRGWIVKSLKSSHVGP